MSTGVMSEIKKNTYIEMNLLFFFYLENVFRRYIDKLTYMCQHVTWARVNLNQGGSRL